PSSRRSSAGSCAIASTRAPKLDPCWGLDPRSSAGVGAGTMRPEARSGSEPRGDGGLHLGSPPPNPERASGREYLLAGGSCGLRRLRRTCHIRGAMGSPAVSTAELPRQFGRYLL